MWLTPTIVSNHLGGIAFAVTGVMFKHALVAAITVTLCPVAARAEPYIDGVGARVGGYGFREMAPANAMAEKSTTGWEACRMNGLGVFATKTLTKSKIFFAEGAIDTYFTDAFPTGESTGNYDTPIDRVSGLLTVAGGARLWPEKRFTPYVQLGIGAELTRVRLPALGMEDSALLPFGFFGVGATVRVGDKLRLGATLRVNAMGYYDDSQFQTELSPQFELATQGQFFFSYAL